MLTLATVVISQPSVPLPNPDESRRPVCEFIDLLFLLLLSLSQSSQRCVAAAWQMCVLITPCCIRACMTTCHVASELLLRYKRMKISVCVCRCMASCIYYRVEPLPSTVWPYTSVRYFILNVPSTVCSSCAAMVMAVRQTFKWNHPDPTTRVCLFTRSESGY